MIPLPKMDASGLMGFAGLTIGISLGGALFTGAALALEAGISRQV